MGTHDSRSIDEVIFDISFNFGHILKGFERCDALMEMLDGSRGLKDRIVAWAHEYDDAWFKRSAGEREDYLADIDDFADKKWRELLSELNLFETKTKAPVSQVAYLAAPDLTPADVIVVGIQVVPIIDDDSRAGIEPQLEGPNELTTGWGIYRRNSFGMVTHIVDVPGAEGYATAMLLGGALAMKYEVEIEPQPWIKDTSDDNRHFVVEWTVDVYAMTPREAAEKAREMQLEPDSSATVFEVVQPGSQVPPQTVDLSEPA